MGREKKHKPRGTRYVAQWRPRVLRELEPPGAFYDEAQAPWWDLRPGQVPQMRDGGSPELITYLAPMYGGQIPPAALLLEAMIHRGTLLLISRSGAEHRITVSEMARVWGAPPGVPFGVFLHIMHAGAVFLITDAYQVRPVVGSPKTHGRWIFMDTATDREYAETTVIAAAGMAAHGRDPDKARDAARALADSLLDGGRP